MFRAQQSNSMCETRAPESKVETFYQGVDLYTSVLLNGERVLIYKPYGKDEWNPTSIMIQKWLSMDAARSSVN
jgi:hypothetical protein